ncbi:uncharacterized protein E0L32_005877 [Thyridium curvatum]|uniref:Uncharacterized protein n=1 Tax=Thyridium curvatum TaxID=1093900 RepID=A0A507B4Q5_9PEZI|nr:uncharacterized protein E0L32_005877 [Thyridium curvatum]TPX13674.1 hypothetical protein E0L32_005877 [Thyridium curvatum]
MFVPNTTSRPPADMAIPYNEQLIFTIATQIPFVIFFGMGLRSLASKGDPLPLLFGIGGCFASSFEPFVDVLGFCFFPREGNWVAFEWLGRPIPVFVPATYGWFVGGMGYWAYTVIRDPKTTRKDIWKLWGKAFIINLVLEYPPLYYGIYTYYGYQPLEVGGFPLWFPATNAITPMVSGAIISLIEPYCKGWRLLAIVTTTASAYGLANAACGFPVWIALSTDLGYAVTYPAAAVTFLLLSNAVWIISLIVPEQRGIKLNGNEKRRVKK